MINGSDLGFSRISAPFKLVAPVVRGNKCQEGLQVHL